MHMAQLMPLSLTVSCSSKIQIGFTFLVPAYPGCPGKEAVKWLLWPTLLPVKPDHQHSQAFIPNLYTQRNSARFSSDYRPACDSAVFCNYGNNLSVVKSNKVTERARIWSGVCVQCRAETSRSRLNRHGSANSCQKETISASASATADKNKKRSFVRSARHGVSGHRTSDPSPPV